MPTASQRDKTVNKGPALGGSRSSSNETPVSSKEHPDPAPRADGNTQETRPAPQETGRRTHSTAAGAQPGDHTEATGRNHPSQTEAPGRQKLHGTSDKRINDQP